MLHLMDPTPLPSTCASYSDYRLDLVTDGGPASITIRSKVQGEWIGTVTAPTAEIACHAATSLLAATLVASDRPLHQA